MEVWLAYGVIGLAGLGLLLAALAGALDRARGTRGTSFVTAAWEGSAVCLLLAGVLAVALSALII